MPKLEFLIPKRPLSLQAKRRNLNGWKAYVRAEAAKVWNGPVIQGGDLQLTLVYLCGVSPPDTDNIVNLSKTPSSAWCSPMTH